MNKNEKGDTLIDDKSIAKSDIKMLNHSASHPHKPIIVSACTQRTDYLNRRIIFLYKEKCACFDRLRTMYLHTWEICKNKPNKKGTMCDNDIFISSFLISFRDSYISDF